MENHEIWLYTFGLYKKFKENSFNVWRDTSPI